MGYQDLPRPAPDEQLWLWPEEPWEGRSPRALTAGYAHGILKAQAKKNVSGCDIDENQYDLWLPVKKAPWRYQGAPLLVDLKRR